MKGWWATRKQEFSRKYGHIGSLLKVPIDDQLLKAAIPFWDPHYRCFTFGSIDMTPTIEEYTVLLSVTGTSPDKAFLHEQRVQEKTRKNDGQHFGKMHLNDLKKEKYKNCCHGAFQQEFW